MSEESWTRRRFLAAVAAGSSLLAGNTLGKAGLPIGTGLPRRPLGNTGVSLPVLGAGMSFDTGPSRILLRQILQTGVSCIDSAASYASSSEGLQRYFTRFPEDRSRAFLILKPPLFRAGQQFSAVAMDRYLDEQLRLNGTDYVDLFALHELNDPGIVRSRDVAIWAENARKSGRIRFFGFSTHDAKACLGAAANAGFHDVVLFAFNYRLMEDRELLKTMDACHAKGIGMITFKFRGLGPGLEDRESRLKLARWSRDGDSLDEAKLKAALTDPRVSCVLATMRDVTTLRSYAAAASHPAGLDGADRSSLIDHARDTRSGYCEGCRDRCEPVAGVPVADVLRFLMYQRAYGEPERAAACYRALPFEVRTRLAADDFQEAERRCPRGLPINKWLHEAARELV